MGEMRKGKERGKRRGCRQCEASLTQWPVAMAGQGLNCLKKQRIGQIGAGRGREGVAVVHCRRERSCATGGGKEKVKKKKNRKWLWFWKFGFCKSFAESQLFSN